MSSVPVRLAAFVVVAGLLSGNGLAADPASQPAATMPAAAGRPGEVQPVEVQGKIDEVTVYRGQAMVTRVVTLDGGAGLHEIVVGDLPVRVQPSSLHAEGGKEVQVRSVRFRTRAVEGDIRDEVRKFDAEAERLNSDLAGVMSELQVLQHHTEYLNKLESFTAPTANTELTRGVLNAETLQKLTAFIFGERERVAKETLAAERRRVELTEQRNLVQRKRGELTGSASHTAREAVLLVDAQQPGAVIRLKYLVDQAWWSPSYTFRATAGAKDVEVLYQAAVTQLSGEDWSNVKMSLSTATPSVVASAPQLDPLKLTLQPDQVAQKKIAIEMEELKAAKAQATAAYNQNFKNHNSEGLNVSNLDGTLRVEDSEAGMNQAANQAANQESANNFGVFDRARMAESQRDNGADLNRITQQLQIGEFVSQGKGAKPGGEARRVENVAVAYSLDGRTSLPSRNDQQMIGIATVTAPADTYKLAIPVLTDYVYNEAEVTNNGKLLMLAGPTTSYFDGEFVGIGQIPTTAAGATFKIGLGVDSTMLASRELVNTEEQVQGGNKIVTYDYKITLQNFGEKPAKVRLLDRMPITDGVSLKPTLVSTTVEQSKEKPEERQKLGILRWDVAAPAGAANDTAVTVGYKLQLEYDRQMNIAAR